MAEESDDSLDFINKHGRPDSLRLVGSKIIRSSDGMTIGNGDVGYAKRLIAGGKV